MLTRTLFSQLLLIASALVLVVDSYEITFLAWFIVAALTLRNRYSVRMLTLLSIPILILCVAAFSMLFYDFNPYSALRDVAYLLKPILGLLIGYNLSMSLGPKSLLTLIYAGFCLAVIHLSKLLFYATFFGIADVNNLRGYGGFFDDLEIYALILLLFRVELGIPIKRKMLFAAFAVIGISSFFYLARTNIIQFIILFIAMKGYLRITYKSVKVMSILLIAVLSGYAAIYYSNPRRQGPGIEAFLYKIKIAPIEPFKTRINTENWKDFHDNYRSYENISTLRQVPAEGNFAVFFGKGLGSHIDLKRKVLSNDGEFIRYIPILHNAYMTIFLKSGIVGVVLLLIFIYFLYRHNRTGNRQIDHLNYLLAGSAVYLILSNWVFMGLYLKLDNKSIVLGLLIAYREWLIHRENQLKTQ